MRPSTVLAVVACACLAWSAAPASADQAPAETARPAVYTAESGRGTEARLTQFVFGSPYVAGYAYAPTSYYVAPPHDATWTTSYYAPGAFTHTSYRPYYVSHWPAGYSYGWLPYAYHYRPAGSFYRYYGPVYGSGFHMWFGY